MSWLSSIGSFFTGGSNTANTVINDVASGLDKLQFTDQEKSAASTKGFELFVEYQKATLPQNIARRQLAMIMLVYWIIVGMFVIYSIVYLVPWGAKMFDFYKSISPYVGAVWAFYYVKNIASTLGGNK